MTRDVAEKEATVSSVSQSVVFAKRGTYLITGGLGGITKTKSAQKPNVTFINYFL